LESVTPSNMLLEKGKGWFLQAGRGGLLFFFADADRKGRSGGRKTGPGCIAVAGGEKRRFSNLFLADRVVDGNRKELLVAGKTAGLRRGTFKLFRALL